MYKDMGMQPIVTEGPNNPKNAITSCKHNVHSAKALRNLSIKKGKLKF